MVSTSIFQFLLGLALWRWLLWTFFAFKLSRTNLKLVPTHPDQHGGLGFLGLTSALFAPIAFTASAVVALVALGPLAFFIPRLTALRRKEILEYGILGQLQSVEFHEKWIVHCRGHETEFLVAPDSIALALYGNTYERIEKLSFLLADKGSLYTLAGAVLIPALPMILAEVPIAVFLKDLLKAMR